MDPFAAEHGQPPAPPRLRFGLSFLFAWMAGIGLALAAIHPLEPMLNGPLPRAVLLPVLLVMVMLYDGVLASLFYLVPLLRTNSSALAPGHLLLIYELLLLLWVAVLRRLPNDGWWLIGLLLIGALINCIYWSSAFGLAQTGWHPFWRLFFETKAWVAIAWMSPPLTCLAPLADAIVSGSAILLAVIEWREGRPLDWLHWWGVVTWIATYLVCVLWMLAFWGLPSL